MSGGLAWLTRDVAPFLMHAEEIERVEPALMRQVVAGYDLSA